MFFGGRLEVKGRVDYEGLLLRLTATGSALNGKVPKRAGRIHRSMKSCNSMRPRDATQSAPRAIAALYASRMQLEGYKVQATSRRSASDWADRPDARG
jgi:hypothetical protein